MERLPNVTAMVRYLAPDCCKQSCFGALNCDKNKKKAIKTASPVLESLSSFNAMAVSTVICAA